MSTLSLSDLLTPITRDDAKKRLLAILSEAGRALPVTDWAPGSFGRQVVEMEAAALADLLGTALPKIIAAGFLDLADDSQIDFKAQQDFEIDRTEAVATVQQIVLTSAPAAGPYTIAVGDLWAVGGTGLRYNNITGGTLASNSTLILQFRAESPGSAYADPSGTIVKLITPLAGVTVVNTAPDFTPVVQGPNGTGTVTPSRTSPGTQPTLNTFLVRIDASGVIGTGGWSYSTNGGQTWTSVGAISSTFALPGGTTITFANGAGTPSFIAGDVFSFDTPGSAILVAGRDRETKAELIARCKARWASLSDVPTNDKIILWALAASPSVNRVRPKASTTVPGQIDVFLAGPAGGVSGSVIATVRDYILARLGITEKVLVDSTSSVTIACAGKVFVSATKLAASQEVAQTAWLEYLQSSSIADNIKLSRLEQILMDAMAGDVNADLGSGGDAIALTGGTPNVQLTTNQVAVAGSSTLATQLTWVPVT